MSVFSYIAGDKGQVKMPREGADRLGIRFSGSVLTGETTVEAGLQAERARALEDLARREEVRERQAGRLEGFDPPLRDQWGRRVR
jgi:hypothetical protein